MALAGTFICSIASRARSASWGKRMPIALSRASPLSMRPRLSTMRGAQPSRNRSTRFEPAFGARTGEHDDRVRVLERLLNDQVRAGERKKAGERGNGECQGSDDDAHDPRRIRCDRVRVMLSGVELGKCGEARSGGADGPARDVRIERISLRGGGLLRRAGPFRIPPA